MSKIMGLNQRIFSHVQSSSHVIGILFQSELHNVLIVLGVYVADVS